MKLTHSTHDFVNAKKILQEGLRPSIETGICEYPRITKDSKVICFTALDNLNDLSSGWGKYHFTLNQNWVRKNYEQFKEHADEFSEEKEFWQFVEKTRLTSYQGMFKKTFNQILSTKPVPIEGIETLMIPSTNFKLDVTRLDIPKNINIKTYQSAI